jgi:HSP20 family protein
VTEVSTLLTRLRDNVLAPLEAGVGLFPFVAPEIRIEQLIREGHLIVRAEMPGLDPANDLKVAVVGGTLHIHARRPAPKRIGAHSEFRYGSLSRSFALPRTARTETATARYVQGILEITFALSEPQPAGQTPPAGRPITIRVVRSARSSRSPSRSGAATHR